MLRRYPFAGNHEDDIAIIAKWCSLGADDVGNTQEGARPLALSEWFTGVVGFGGDVDMFAFNAPASKQLVITLSLVNDYAPSDTQYFQRTNLNAELALQNASGHVLQTWDSTTRGILSGVLVTKPLPYAVRGEALKFYAGRWTSGTS